ncbi:zinc-binding dehydrogenase [Sphaerisporangium corydalis]|uniref:Zinc-binding dehydrogenase n=1 Tax=Sphaerisporangium corydalis TaxID=1441875 RepID=A0ABV9EIU1_9ACTN|nr:zinc-binding dehydrogenase [Sphaerisporangium corydalis]
MPAGVDPADAEAVLVNGVTAWQMLHRSARVRSGQTILVHGAGGGVGGTLIQLARHAGIRVIEGASPRHHDALRAAGLFALVADGTLKPAIAARFPLGEAAAALALAESRTVSGKVILLP